MKGTHLPMIDVDDLRDAWVTAEAARKFAETILASIKTPLLVLSEDLRVTVANGAFYSAYRSRPEDVENQLFLEMTGKQWDLPGLRAALGTIGKNRASSADVEFEGQLAGKWRAVCIGLRALQPDEKNFVLVEIDDITQRKRAESVLLVEQQQLRTHMEAGAAELLKADLMLQNEAWGREQVESALHASERALFKSREELRQLSASLMNAQDAERRRVSRELHDDLSQKVAKLQFDIEILEQKVPFEDVIDAKRRLRGVAGQAAALSNDLRRVAHQLHPATLDHLGLAVALRSYAEEFSQSTAIPVTFTSLYVPREVPLELASGIYRIVQEALRNVGKHASNGQVEIVLARDPDGLALFIRDNGEGFDLESARLKGGLGLISMQERVRLLGGKFSIESRCGAGVLISIQCPLPPEKK